MLPIQKNQKVEFITMMKIGYDIEFPCSDFETSLLTLSGYFHSDPSVRLEVAAALKDDEADVFVIAKNNVNKMRRVSDL